MTLSVRPVGPWTCGVCGARGDGYESYKTHDCSLHSQTVPGIATFQRRVLRLEQTVRAHAEGRAVIGVFEAEYGVRAPYVPSPHSATARGLLTFTVLEKD